MNKETTVAVLNTLIEINNDRIRGYQTASKETEESDMKTVFSQFAQTSQKCKAELIAEVLDLGGEPTEGTSTSGKIYRAWMDVKAALTGKERGAILSSCEFGEDAAVETYDSVLETESESLDSRQLTLVTSQREAIKSEHDRIRSMRDSMAA